MEKAEKNSDFQTALGFGAVRVGKGKIYCKRFLTWYGIPWENIERVWRRTEIASTTAGCCRNEFPIHKLGIRMKDGTEEFLTIGEADREAAAERLLHHIRQEHPDLIIGKLMPES